MTTRLVAMALLVSASMFADEVRIVRQGMALPDQPGPQMTANIIRFLASSSYQSTAYAVKSNTWATLLESDSYVHLKLNPARLMKLPEPPPEDFTTPRKRADVMINEIIVPLPEEHSPLHIYARSGTNVVSHTKFSPLVFKELIQEPALKLSGTKVYKEFSRLPGLD